MSTGNFFKRNARYVRCMGRKRKLPREPYGEWLKFLRVQRGLTQEEVEMHLAHALHKPNLNSHILSHWEGSGKIPGRDVLLALCEIYHCTIETLLCVEWHPDQRRYVARDSMIKKAMQGNAERDKLIKTKNRDPHL
jgi:transcriptional regulator with XRE-family HTH domain